MKICLMLNNCLKSHHIIHDTTVSICTGKYLVLLKNDIVSSHLIACCKLAPTSTRKTWRHNYVIGFNEYLISTLPESTIPWVHSPQFLFKSTNNSWRYERKCEWVFFLNPVYSWPITIGPTHLLIGLQIQLHVINYKAIDDARGTIVLLVKQND